MNLTNTQKVVAVVAVLVVLGIGAYSYAFRPVAAPSTPTPVAPAPTDEHTDGDEHADEDLHAHDHTYVIDASASKATFEVDEVLRNAPFHVVGTTSDVSGSFVANHENLSAATVSEIRINARTIKTDNNSRNAMIGRFILDSEKPENEFIVFKATSIRGMPKDAGVNEDVSFDIVGDLTIKGTTKEVTFKTTAKFVDHDTITGSANTTINYKDFNLTIPSVPQVASVENDVKLSIDFTGRVAE